MSGSIDVTCVAEFTPDDHDDILTVGMIEKWLLPIPSGAQLEAIYGNSNYRLRGLRATWREVRDE